MGAEQKRRSISQGNLRSIASWALVILIGIALASFCKAFIGSAYAIPSGSMESTLEVGDRILAEKVSLESGIPAVPGDTVTFIDPSDSSRILIKRVIATEGQRVDLQDGRVLVDGRPIDEP